MAREEVRVGSEGVREGGSEEGSEGVREGVREEGGGHGEECHAIYMHY